MPPFVVRGKTYESYEHFLAENLSIIERVADVFSGLDERLDFLNKTMLRIEFAQLGIPTPAAPPAVPSAVPVAVLPEFPPIAIPDPLVLLRDAVLVDIALDLRRFLIMLYRLGRAYEIREFDYIELGAGETDSFHYPVPSDYVLIPHIEEVTYGIQRVITREDKENGDVKSTEPYAIDRSIEWAMTPLSKTITGSLEIEYENTGATDTWVKSTLIGTLLSDSDYLWWRRTVRSLGDKYIGLTA